jgi:hypothetical protein
VLAMTTEENPLTDSQKILLAKISEELKPIKEAVERIEQRNKGILRAGKEIASNAVGIFERLLK